LADNYAKEGFYCYIPDFFQGDSLPIEFLQSVEPPLKTREKLTLADKATSAATVGTTLGPWLLKHSEASVKPLITSFVSAVRSVQGTGKVGAIGFCWGGRYAILASHGEVDAAVACHPALLAIPGDFEGITKPLSLAVGGEDSLLDSKSVGSIQDLFGGLKSDHELRIYEGQVHGFAIRSDWSDENDKKAMDEAEAQGRDWFGKYLS
jgi:dienelactone hydrolase